MDWFMLLVMGAGVVAAWRIYVAIRNLRNRQEDDWDSRVIERLRAQGSDPFKPHEVDFFFALPTEEASRTVQGRLEADGFKVDFKHVPENVSHPFSLHASKSIRLSVPDMREMSRAFTQMATEQGGRYDGWTAGVVTREA